MINNQLEFNLIIGNAIKEALDNTTEICLNKLIDFIEQEVYSGYSPTWYDRTDQFRDSWIKEKATIKGKIIESEIYQEFGMMVHNPDLWQHGNPWSSLKPDGLSEIINNGLSGNIANFPQISARPFWDKFVLWIENNLNFTFQLECRKLGLDLNIGIKF